MDRNDFAIFFKAAEQKAIEAKIASLFSQADAYYTHGLYGVAIALYKHLDTPGNITHLVNNAIKNFQPAIDPYGNFIQGDKQSVDAYVERIREDLMRPTEEIQREEELEDKIRLSDPNLRTSGYTYFEVEIVHHTALANLRIGNVGEALKNADRLAAIKGNPTAQIIAAAVYSSQEMVKEASGLLEGLSKMEFLPILHSMPYFEAVKDVSSFRHLQLSGSIMFNYAHLAPVVELSDQQVYGFVETAKEKAEGEYRKAIMDDILDYYDKNVENYNFENAEVAAKKAVEIFGKNGITAQLLGIVFNNTGRYQEAIEILSSSEKDLHAAGKWELARALAETGDLAGAYSRFEAALVAIPHLVAMMELPNYRILHELKSQPGYGMLMLRTNAARGNIN